MMGVILLETHLFKTYLPVRKGAWGANFGGGKLGNYSDNDSRVNRKQPRFVNL